jgi:hypothetical protein
VIQLHRRHQAVGAIDTAQYFFRLFKRKVFKEGFIEEVFRQRGFAYPGGQPPGR